MKDFQQSVFKIRYIDELSEKSTIIHGLNPLAKLIVTIAFILCVMSFSKYNIISFIPFVLYIIVIFSIGQIPYGFILKRALCTLPFILGISIFNIIFDTNKYIKIYNIPITMGMISSLSLIIRTLLCVSAGLLFIATTGIENLSIALRMLRVPKIFTLQIVLTYRYIVVLIESLSNTWNAYKLRAPNQKGINFNAWGSFIGHILIRSFDKAQRVYSAMILRGFNGEYNTGKTIKFLFKDFLYVVIWIIIFLIIKFLNIPLLIGRIMIGV